MFKNATVMDGRSSDLKSWKAVMLIAVLILSVFAAAMVADSELSDATDPSITVKPTGPLTLYSNGTTDKTKEIEVTIDPQGKTNLTLSVTCSNSKVSVSSSSPTITNNKAKFTITASSAGTSTVTVTLNNTGLTTAPTATINVTVKTYVETVEIVDSSGASIPDHKMTLEKTKTALIKEKVGPAAASDKSVTWSSSDSSIVKVEKTQNEVKLTAVGPGTATIKAKANDGSNKEGILTVNVEVKVTGVTLEVVGEPTVKIKHTIKVIATIEPADATNKNITVTTDNPSLLGVVTPIPDPVGNKITFELLGKGDTSSPTNVKVTVTTQDQQKTATTSIKVERIPVKGITLDHKTLQIEMDDKGVKLVGKTDPEDATVSDILWSSSDTTVATVDSSGNITPVKVGYTTITATTKEGGFKAECLVTVTNNITIDLVASQDSQGNATLTDTQVTNTITEINKLVANKQYPLIAIDAGFSYNLTIQSNLVKAIQDANGSQLYADFLLGEVLFDADAVDNIDTSGKTVGISFTEVDESKYPKFGACYIYDISILKDGNKIETNFGSDRAEIAIYHDLKTGEDKDKLLAAYVIREDYGLKIKDASVITDGDWDESAVVIKAPHMSLFMFMFHESEYVKTAGIDTVIAIVFLVIIVILAAGIAFFTFNENASEKLQNLFKRNNTKRPPMSPPGQEPYGYYPGNQFNGYGNNYNSYNNNNGNNNYR